MSAQLQKAISMMSVLPEQYLSALIQQMQEYQRETITTEESKKDRTPSDALKNIMKIVEERNARERAKKEEEKARDDLPFSQEEFDAFMARQEIDPQKAAAFDRLEKWREEHQHLFGRNFDYDQARWEALNEKYGPFN